MDIHLIVYCMQISSYGCDTWTRPFLPDICHVCHQWFKADAG